MYTASSQIIKRIILRHLEHPVSILSLFKRNLAHERGVAITKDFPVVFLVLFFGHYGVVSLNLDPVITNSEHAMQSVRWVLFVFFQPKSFRFVQLAWLLLSSCSWWRTVLQALKLLLPES